MALLRIENLRTYFHTAEGLFQAVDGVSFHLDPGETLGIVGESGCGKTLACLSILRLLDPPGRIEPGSLIEFRGIDLVTASEKEMRAIRGNEIAMVFQEPMTSLNPVLTIGQQISEAVRAHRRVTRTQAHDRSVELLGLVGIPEPALRRASYPHELSGGMRQRAMIAMALAGEPAILIADEPTTALDVTIQAEILDLLASLKRRLGMAMILVSHDLAVVAQVVDRLLVMYAGQVVEAAGATEAFGAPRHPYAEGLLRSIPRADRRVGRLEALPGAVPDPRRWPDGCRFHPRCKYAWDRCRHDAPPLLGDSRFSRCWLEEEPKRRRLATHGVRAGRGGSDA